jgi:xylulose-5-phosphate/fructose-6-phosphate phosphoketolase
MLETVAAAWWLRQIVPDLRVRVVNVVDLMRLFPAAYHPHGMTSAEFAELFTVDKPVVFAFHGYRRAIHEIVHGHPDVDRIHVRGFNEQGTTTTPFQMVVLNEVSRFHLAAEAIRRVPRLSERAPSLIADCDSRIEESVAYAHEHLEDQAEIRDWVWTE